MRVAGVGLCLALLAGCDGDVSIPVYATGHDAGAEAMIVEAAAVWDLGVEWRSSHYGAVQISLRPGTPRFSGATPGDADSGCEDRRLWAVPEPLVIAHELGHVFGQTHHPVEGNLMYKSGGSGLSDEQLDEVRKRVAQLRRRCRTGADL